PTKKSDAEGGLSGLVQADSPAGINYLSGLLSSKAAIDSIGEPLGLKNKEVREGLKVEPQVTSRQLWVSFRSKKSDDALTAVKSSLDFLRETEDSVQGDASKKRLEGIRSRVSEKVESLNNLREQLAEFLRNSKTVPSSEDE